MSKVYRRDGEDIEIMIKRFKRQVNNANTLYEVRRHEFFVPKSLRRKMKAEETAKRIRRGEKY